MKKTLVTILKYLIFLGLGIWVTYHMLHQLSPDESQKLWSAINQSLHPPWFLISISIVGFFSHYVRAVRWRYLLETIDLKPTLTNTLFAVMIGYITNLALPRAGEVAKCTVLAKYEGMPAHKMVGTIVAERTFDLLSLMIIALITFLLEMNRINSYVADHLGPYLLKIKEHENILILGCVLFAAALVFLVFLYRRHKESKFGLLLKEMSYGITSIVHMKKKWEFLALTIVMWLMYTAQIYLGFLSLHIVIDKGFLAALVVLVWGSIGLIITPGGIGLYPLLVSQILEGPYNLDTTHAQAFGWIAWAVQTSVIIILGVFSLLLIHSYNKKRNAKASVDPK